MSSFSIIRTNTALTTNIKILVTSDYQLYLESIDSIPELSNTKYKHYLINKDIYYDEVLPVYWKDTSPETSFSIKDDFDSDKMFDDFDRQFDDIYWSGCQGIPDTFYKEEFEAFAPLYLDKNSLPTHFIIFRVDGAGITNEDKTTFNQNVLDKLKVVKVFDLINSPIGEFIKKNVTNNVYFPNSPLDIDIRSHEFTKWNGIDYATGGYTSKSLFMEDFYEKSNLFYYFDKTITDGYKNNAIVFPNIWNLTFLFDDTPATKTSLKKWSINKYYTFYINSLDLVSNLTLWRPKKLKSDIQIVADNLIQDLLGNPIDDPTIDGWDDSIYYYVEIEGQYYTIIRYFDNDILVYKIISDLDLTGKEIFINKNIINIDTNGYITYNNSYNNSIFNILNFDDADVWVIKINNQYFRLKKDTNGYFIYSDYGFNLSDDIFEYYLNSPDPNFSTKINIKDVNADLQPISVSVYRVNFTDIKDFDNKIKETDWSKYEYENKLTVDNTAETKIYGLDNSSNQHPQPVEVFEYNNSKIHIPVSSEYVGTNEIFVTDPIRKTIIPLWRKNHNWLKWGYQNSICSYDYVYRLNNALIGEDFNRSSNIMHYNPIEIERNLNHFYTINSTTNSYVFQSLNINGYDSNLNIDSDFSFDIKKYFGLSYSGDYFKYIFSKKDYFDNSTISINSTKYSTLNNGDKDTPNSTLFRGIKFNFYDIKSVVRNSGTIQSITLQPSIDLSDYNFSILLSDFRNDIDNNFSTTSNSLSWSIIPNYQNGTSYATNSIVIWNDILFESTQINNINDPNFNPSSFSYWTVSSITNSIFWNPNITYITSSSIIYNTGDYWRRNNNIISTASDIWSPLNTYVSGSYILYKGQSYQSNNSIQLLNPDQSIIWNRQTNPVGDKWDLVQNWNITANYLTNSAIVKDDIVYISTDDNIGIDPSSPSQVIWSRYYSLIPDTNYVYGSLIIQNNIIALNDAYYNCISNTDQSTLDNGINIYINKKFKNILIHIYINDNTTTNLKNSDRSSLYNSLNSKMTANNLLRCLNDIENSYGYTNNLAYYLINDDLTFIKYDNTNLEIGSYLILGDVPDELLVRLRSFINQKNDFNKSLLKINKKLDLNKIDNTLFNLNYYNNGPISYTYKPNDNDITIVQNYSGIKNSNYAQIFRFNGFYSPIFYSIDLFKAYDLNDNLSGNYKFDSTLTNFGLCKERIFSKVNLKGNKLRLLNFPNEKSIYPMVDEFGYSIMDFYLFKSTWDNSYYIESNIQQ